MRDRESAATLREPDARLAAAQPRRARDGASARGAALRAVTQMGAPVDRVAAALRALADPTRFRLYLTLRRGEACVCELAEELGLAENLVSHHLKALRRIGLVYDRRDPTDARWVYYQLDAATLTTLFAALGALFDPQTLGTRLPTCGPAAAPQLVMPTRTPTAARSHDVDEPHGE